MTDIGLSFRDAEGAMLPELARCLDALSALPAFRAYKAATWAALDVRAGGKILDVACGTGFDLIEMAKRHPASKFCGVDRSEGFLAIARTRAAGLDNLRFEPGDACALPFPAGAFDGVRIDRSLQHIADPRGAVREMVRVARAGGRLAAAEPDWGTYLLYNGDLSNDGLAAGETLAAQWRGSIRNPFIGRELGALFSACGAVGLRGAAHAFSTSDLSCAETVFDLERVLAGAVASDALTAAAAARWRAAALAASEKGAFFAALTIVTFFGVVGG
jgi:SAM-dependent methyltransferase